MIKDLLGCWILISWVGRHSGNTTVCVQTTKKSHFHNISPLVHSSLTEGHNQPHQYWWCHFPFCHNNSMGKIFPLCRMMWHARFCGTMQCFPSVNALLRSHACSLNGVRYSSVVSCMPHPPQALGAVRCHREKLWTGWTDCDRQPRSCIIHVQISLHYRMIFKNVGGGC